ncbi:MAG: NYN domain-containing protein [Gammaproteobacteria bacterium]
MLAGVVSGSDFERARPTCQGERADTQGARVSRVTVYVDGFNLYFGLRSKGWRKYYWLDLVRLSQALLKPGQEIEAIHYFTSRLLPNGYNSGDIDRQNTYLEALSTLPLVTLHFGLFLDNPQRCRRCGTAWMSYEEKMTDVNIAVRLLADAFENRFDTALLISADSDLTTPVQQVLSRFPDKRVIVAQPPRRNSVSLCGAASGYFTIGETKLRGAQMPSRVERADGGVFTRTARWQ